MIAVVAAPPGSSVREAPAPYGASPDEATLAALWEGQRFPGDALRLADGRRVRVIYRGRRGRASGPDFRDAVLAIGGEPARYGDVELHVRAGDWRAHGHHLDPAYATVILQVVFEPPGLAESSASAPGGSPIPTVALGPWVARRSGDLAAWLSGPDLWREPCHGARQALGDDGVGAELERMGLRRLRERAAQLLQVDLGGGRLEPDELLHVAIYEALGYPRNREPFRRLAELCRWRELESALRDCRPEMRGVLAEALLFGRSGLLGGEVLPPLHRQGLRRLAAERRARPGMAAGAWRRWGVRPENRPERRIAAAAALAVRFAGAEDGPLGVLAAATERSTSALLAALEVEPAFPWGGGALIGRGRAIEIATNAVLPLHLALAERRGDRVAEGLIKKRYLALPRPQPYGRTVALERAIAGGGRTLVRNAAGQQSLLYLQERYCARGRCGRCPLSPPVRG